ncbi:MAG TPA: hypothetical protein PK954_18085 [Anaerolineales bacterium]|nr:hypothetical protein [Anaerolineales bacterium]HRF50076.1 hypothetical protein [Anaerolineales bacterium]
MSSQPESEAELFWSAILSEEPPRIRKAWLSLTDDEAAAVLAHLNKMATEEGWADVQRVSAGAALRAIRALAE